MNFPWEQIGNFGSLRERDCFVAWLQKQIASGVAEEIDAPPDAGERWFRHIPTGSLWRLISDENPYGPGFWPAHDDGETAAKFDNSRILHGTLPQAGRDHRSWPPLDHR
jgi:hypothetical protein